MNSATIRKGARCVLLGLILLTIALGCGGGDGPSDYERAKKTQTDAVAALQQVGGKVVEFRHPKGDAWKVQLPGVQFTDETFAHLQALGRIAGLNLSKSSVTDADMPKINEIGKLFLELDLSYTAVTDAGLDALTDLYVLGDLNLVGSKATPA